MQIVATHNNMNEKKEQIASLIRLDLFIQSALNQQIFFSTVPFKYIVAT